MKKIVALMLALAMTASLAACGSSSAPAETTAAAETEAAAAETEAAAAETEAAEAAADETAAADAGELVADEEGITINICHASAEETVLHRACVKYAELLNEYSGGAITATVYPNGSLFGVAEMNEAIKDGSTQVIAGSPGAMLSTSLGFFELPNTISSVEQAHEVMQDGHEFRTILNGLFDEAGVRLQAIEPCDFRMLTSNKEVKNFSEINGLKIRVMDSEIPMSYWAQWGAQPTPIAWPEVYMSLQQNKVDAQENPYDSILGSNLQEVQKYIIDTRHVMFYTAFMMNKGFYEARTDNMKAIIDKAANDAAAFAYQDALDSSAANRQKLEDAGMTFIEFTQDDWDQMRANATEADEKIKASIGEDLFGQLMGALGL